MAIDNWLEELIVGEEILNKIKNTRDRIQETILQMQYDEEGSAHIQFIASLWGDILDLLTKPDQTSRDQLIMKTLELFETGNISRELTHQMIVKSFI